jgi:hypothetical protein
MFSSHIIVTQFESRPDTGWPIVAFLGSSTQMSIKHCTFYEDNAEKRVILKYQYYNKIN